MLKPSVVPTLQMFNYVTKVTNVTKATSFTNVAKVINVTKVPNVTKVTYVTIVTNVTSGTKFSYFPRINEGVRSVSIWIFPNCFIFTTIGN